MEVNLPKIRHEVPIRVGDGEEARALSTIIYFGTNHVFADQQDAWALKVMLDHWDLDPAERETCEFWLAMKTMERAAGR